MSKITLEDIRNFSIDGNIDGLSDKEKIKRNMFAEVQKFLKDNLDDNPEPDVNKKITRALNNVLDAQGGLLKSRHRINDIILGCVSVDDELELHGLNICIAGSKKNLWNKVFFDKIGVSLMLQAVHELMDTQVH